MADVSERTLQLSVLVAFASGVLVGWQANRLRRRYLDWRKKRLQDKLAATQKKLDLAWDPRAVGPRRPPRGHLEATSSLRRGAPAEARLASLSPPAVPGSCRSRWAVLTATPYGEISGTAGYLGTGGSLERPQEVTCPPRHQKEEEVLFSLITHILVS